MVYGFVGLFGGGEWLGCKDDDGVGFGVVGG